MSVGKIKYLLTYLLFRWNRQNTVDRPETICDINNSNFCDAAREVCEWTESNNMSVNARKTKEMLITSQICPPNFEPVVIKNVEIERVSSHKLLGVTITNDLSWTNHINDICSKANKRLHYLILLRRAGVDQSDLIIYYKQVIRSLLEYCCQIWHNSLNKSLSDKIENIQTRATKIISQAVNPSNLDLHLETLYDRREKLCIKYFEKISHENHTLFNLLPESYDHGYNTRFKTLYPKPLCKTDRFKNSFVNYGLLNYQNVY